jgi:hypothetical protein
MPPPENPPVPVPPSDPPVPHPMPQSVPPVPRAIRSDQPSSTILSVLVSEKVFLFIMRFLLFFFSENMERLLISIDIKSYDRRSPIGMQDTQKTTAFSIPCFS